MYILALSDIVTQETEEIQSRFIEMQPSRNLLTMRDAEKNQKDEMQKEEIQEEDASPGPARQWSTKDDVSGMRQGKLWGLRDRKKDAGLSPARIRCMLGKIVSGIWDLNLEILR